MSVKKIVIGTFFAILISFVLTCLLAVVVHFSNIGERVVSAIIFGVSVVSVIFGALIMAKNIDSRGLLHGVALGFCYFLVLAVVSVAANGGISLSSSNFLRLFATLAAGALGGVLGINTKKES